MGKRELIALLNLSSWCLVMVERLFLMVPRGCLQFVIVVFPDHTHLLFLAAVRSKAVVLLSFVWHIPDWKMDFTGSLNLTDILLLAYCQGPRLLSCQPRVTVTSCFVYHVCHGLKRPCTLRRIEPTYADVWKIQQVRWYTLSTLEISLNTLRIRYNTVVYVDIWPRGPTFCTSIKNYSVCERTASIHWAYARCTLQVSYAYVSVR